MIMEIEIMQYNTRPAVFNAINKLDSLEFQFLVE